MTDKQIEKTLTQALEKLAEPLGIEGYDFAADNGNDNEAEEL